MKKSEKEIKPSMHQFANYRLFENARELRKNETAAERKLWEAIRRKKLNGYKFRRQHPLGLYILDFYCHAKKLGIELDGGYHIDKGQKFLDNKRTEQLGDQHIEIIRFKNEEVLQNLEEVLEKIRKKLEEIT